MRSLSNLVKAGLAVAVTAAMAFPAMPIPVPAQQDARQGRVIRSQVNLVNVFVTVRDKNKRIVDGFEKRRL